MIKTTTLSVGILCLGASVAQADLLITGIIDGPLTGGTPKAIELYATADIADLSIYGIELVSNANSSAGAVETAFSGSISAGSYFYVASDPVEFTNVFGFAPDIVTDDVNHNGDDDFYLYKNGLVIDVWGGSNGLDNTGTAYDVLDSWAYRKNGTGPSATFNVDDWIIAPVDSLDGLAASEVNDVVPFGTYVPEPASLALLGLGGLMVAGRRRA